MKLEEVLIKRSDNRCEICKTETPLQQYEVLPQTGSYQDSCIMICNNCLLQIEKKAELDTSHWRKCLPDSMWKEVPGIQVVSWRMLHRFSTESWAADCLDMMYLDDDKLAWAKATGDHDSDAAVALHKDCNGQVLQTGDTIILTKSLDVKGATLNAKLGTVVKNIRLVQDNTEQIEGRIDGQVIVILTKYVRKQSS